MNLWLLYPHTLYIIVHIVVVRFKGVGNAPIMKQNMYKITATNRFQAVIQFLRRELGWQSGEPLVRSLIHVFNIVDEELLCLQFLYINSTFSPAPDDTVLNLFKVSGLLLHHSRSSLINLVFFNWGLSHCQLQVNASLSHRLCSYWFYVQYDACLGVIGFSYLRIHDILLVTRYNLGPTFISFINLIFWPSKQRWYQATSAYSDIIPSRILTIWSSMWTFLVSSCYFFFPLNSSSWNATTRSVQPLPSRRAPSSEHLSSACHILRISLCCVRSCHSLGPGAGKLYRSINR